MVRSLYVTNSAYTHNNFTINTGSLDTKFTAEGDHFYLKITATKADGTEKEEVVKLAEFTDELSYISEWTRVDLTGFGTDVTKLTFDFDCNKSMVPTIPAVSSAGHTTSRTVMRYMTTAMVISSTTATDSTTLT